VEGRRRSVPQEEAEVSAVLSGGGHRDLRWRSKERFYRFDIQASHCQSEQPQTACGRKAMRAFLVTLLMVFAFGLCGLITFQWVREVRLRHNIQGLTDTVQNKSEAIQNLNGVIKRSEDENTRLEGIKKDLTETVKTNRAEIARLEKELDKSLAETERQIKQVEVYKDALKKANESIQHQNNTISQQNEEMKKLAEERNAVVVKLNKTVEEFNDLVKKWNEQQTTLAASATNAPAKK
jgi:septal ring factor EnvC (AmiA/AmiB activator)